MCRRYRRTTKEEELARIYGVPIPPQLDLPISYNIAPSQNVSVIRCNPKKAQRSLDVRRCGLIPYWAEDPKIGYRCWNYRYDLWASLQAIENMELEQPRFKDRRDAKVNYKERKKT